MNLQEQIGALETGIGQLLQIARAASTKTPPADEHKSDESVSEVMSDAAQSETGQPVLQIGRPSQNEITMTIGGQTVSLHPLQVGQLIEELANARASMLPEPPANVPPDWRFAATRNPAMIVQKQSNGERLLVLRHTGHGWVPFTFSPDVIIQMYTLLTQR